MVIAEHGSGWSLLVEVGSKRQGLRRKSSRRERSFGLDRPDLIYFLGGPSPTRAAREWREIELRDVSQILGGHASSLEDEEVLV